MEKAGMTALIRAAGNAGFEIDTGSVCVAVDAFFEGSLGFSLKREKTPDLLLVTHSHWDHFDPAAVAEAAKQFGARVVCPGSAARRLRGKIAADAIVELEPCKGESQSASLVTAGGSSVRVTAYRTEHAQDHNSYLIEFPGLRCFHDGDNENTRMLDAGAVAGVDIMFLAPWQGSGWPEFVERASPRHWFLIHLTEEELDEHQRGTYLPALCRKVPIPERIVALRPGGSFRVGKGHEEA